MTLAEAQADFRRDFITRVLVACTGNRTQAARSLGIRRTHIHWLIRSLKIAVPIQVPPPKGGRPRRPI